CPRPFLAGQGRLVEEEKAISVPAYGRDHAERVVPAGRRNHLSRELAPRTRLMELGAMPSESASRTITARLALPSSGAAVTDTRSGSPRHATPAFARAFGRPRTRPTGSVGRRGLPPSR